MYILRPSGIKLSVFRLWRLISWAGVNRVYWDRYTGHRQALVKTIIVLWVA
jgi:hypothetical protein